jgi:hypothetical protein
MPDSTPPLDEAPNPRLEAFKRRVDADLAPIRAALDTEDPNDA